jgi:hypothetical protein
MPSGAAATAGAADPMGAEGFPAVTGLAVEEHFAAEAVGSPAAALSEAARSEEHFEAATSDAVSVAFVAGTDMAIGSYSASA